MPVYPGALRAADYPVGTRKASNPLIHGELELANFQRSELSFLP
jgi:hypothetical protein